ncbi:MAG: helix-turn-helix domain-containing protein [Nevskiaceae bacterium]|nr:MAG: helix-turn-helix domain-containing protein [Nevskiaceae bacterium]TBR73670.1 MAG: helix-turn-helix domain-containing protein [Nevskiaceae bacterium]
MSSDFPSGQPDSSAPQAGVSTLEPDGPGRLIRAARERAQISLEELAAQTKLARPTLEALERDDFSRLSEPVYVQGYYRKCAKALGLSADTLVAAYQRLAHPGRAPVPSKLLLAGESSELAGSGRSRISGWWVALVIVAGVLLLLWAAGRFVRTPSLAEATTGTSAPIPAPQSSVPAAAGSPSEAAAESPVGMSDAATGTEASVAGAADATATAPQSPDSPAGTPIAAPAASAAPSAPVDGALPPAAAAEADAVAAPAATESNLELKFNASSWVRITDAKGTVLLSGTQHAGQSKSVTGVAPYALVVGNAHEVQVFYDGKPVAFTSYISPNSTARFAVP